MGDKSPQGATKKKAGRSIKEKRADKKAKHGGVTDSVVIVPPGKRA